MKHEFTAIMTVGEAAEKWGGEIPDFCKAPLHRNSRAPPRLTTEECRKSGNAWLVTKAGMERLYGPEKEGKE